MTMATANAHAAAAAATKYSFRRILAPLSSTTSPSREYDSVYLVLHQAPIQEFAGDYTVTSTNRRLEGVHRKHWWGFAGRSGCDASLHDVYRSSKSYSNYLVAEARMELKKVAALDNSSWRLSRRFEGKDDELTNQQLPFAASIITSAGPLLPNIRKGIVHTCVPRYPGTGNQEIEPQLHTTLPHAWVSSSKEALDLLQKCYNNVFCSILQNEEEVLLKRSQVWCERIHNIMFSGSEPASQCSSGDLSICLPAIGCGYNGYPIEEAANIALDCIYCIGDGDNRERHSGHMITDGERTITVEIRFKEIRTLRIWRKEMLRRSRTQFQSMD